MIVRIVPKSTLDLPLGLTLRTPKSTLDLGRNPLDQQTGAEDPKSTLDLGRNPLDQQTGAEDRKSTLDLGLKCAITGSSSREP